MKLAKPKPKKKVVKISTLKKKLWAAFSRYVRLRDAIRTTGTCGMVKCITCGILKPTTETDAGHFYSRSYASIFIHEKNVHSQCKCCNMPPRSGEQFLYSMQILKMYGQKVLDELTDLRFVITKRSKNWYIEQTEIYKQKFLDLEKEHGSPWA